MKIVLNDLFDYENLKIYQSVEGFKFSLDSILLSEYVKITSKTKNILDLCTGNASIPLILSTKTKSNITGFEIQKEIYDLAKKSVLYNKLDHQITLYNDDVKNIDNYLFNEKYDIITCNPPYFKLENNKNINMNEMQAIARHEIKIDLESIFDIAKRHLNDKGELYLVHRVSRLDDIIILANKNNLNVKNICLIKTRKEDNPSILLVRCIKNSKCGVKISNPICVNGLKTYKNLFKEDL